MTTGDARPWVQPAHGGVTRTCRACGATFTLTADDVAYFQARGHKRPRRCRPCRAVRRARRAGQLGLE
mgnify:FL=1